MVEVLDFSRDSDKFYENDIETIEPQDLDPSSMRESSTTFSKDSRKIEIVGINSQINFFNHHKMIDKVKQENYMFNIKDSLFTTMLASQEKANLLPKKLGIIKTRGSETAI